MQEIIWSVCSENECQQLQGFVNSLRNHNYSGRIVVWSEFEISGAETRPIDPSVMFDSNGLWKFEYLKRVSQIEQNAIFSYFSPKHFNIRSFPSSFSSLMKDEDVFSFVENNIISPSANKNTWSGINAFQLFDAAKSFGMARDVFYNLNANHFIIKSSFINDFISLIYSVPDHLRRRGFRVNDELMLAYAINTSAKNIENMTMETNKEWYGIDWKGAFKDRLPDGLEWGMEEYFTGKIRQVNPSIIMCPNSLEKLSNLGKNYMGKSIVSEKDKPVKKDCRSCQRSRPGASVAERK